MINFEDEDEIEKFILGKANELKVTYDLCEDFEEWIKSSMILESQEKFQPIIGCKVLTMPVYGCLLIIKANYSFPDGRYSNKGSDFQVIGLKKLDKNYDHLIIRPETFADKVSELLVRTEIDFKDFPKFSSKYFFVSNDRLLAEQFATTSRLTLIEQQKGLVLEVIGSSLFARFPRKLNEEDINNMISFIKSI